MIEKTVKSASKKTGVVKTKDTKVPRKSSKEIDVKQYRIYIVAQNLIKKGDKEIADADVFLYGKDEDMKFDLYGSVSADDFSKRVKGFIAIPKGLQMPKEYLNMSDYNKAFKKVKGALRIS